MGTQTNIANKIIVNKADYILAVKGNQQELLNEIKDEFRFSKTVETDINVDIGHGPVAAFPAAGHQILSRSC